MIGSEDVPDCRSEDAVTVGLGEAIHWIAFGYAAAPADDRGSIAWDEAERDLLRFLQLGEIVASGLRHGIGERQEIPAHSWIDVELESLHSYVFRKNRPWGQNEWEQVCLYRRDIVRRWPSPLSISEISVTNTPYWWSLNAVVAWVIARDYSTVVAMCRSRSAVDKGAVFAGLRDHGKSFKAARREVFEALAGAEVTAYGDRGDGLQQHVPAVQWSRPHNRLEDGTDRNGPYEDVVIARDDVMRRWRPNDGPMPDTGIPVAAAHSPTGPSGSSRSIKRKGGRSAAWAKRLKKYLLLRLEKGADLEAMSLTDLRKDFVNYAMVQKFPKIPKARSSLDVQIKKMREQVLAERRAHEQHDREPEPPLNDIFSVPEIRRE